MSLYRRRGLPTCCVLEFGTFQRAFLLPFPENEQEKDSKRLLEADNWSSSSSQTKLWSRLQRLVEDWSRSRDHDIP